MEKKIKQKQEKIIEAKHERARRKVIYDSTVIITEGQRKMVLELESKSESALRDFMEADKIVEKHMSELQELAEKLEPKEDIPEPN